MALKTKAQYVASVRELGADVYMLGKRVPDVTRNGFTRLALEGIGGIYDLARDDRYEGLLTKREKGGPPYSADCPIHSSREGLGVRGRDLTCAGALTDPKGNRALKPKQQPDKDVYVRVVEESRDGIVVRGAKAMIGGAVGSHEIIVQPGTGFSEDERDHAVAFAVPMDAEGGVPVVNRQPGAERQGG